MSDNSEGTIEFTDDSVSQPTQAAQPIGVTTDPLAVLIVDDDAMLSSRIDAALTEAGYHTKVAHDGQEGFAMAMEAYPAMILSDYQMPNLNGLEMARKIRQDPWGANVPLVIMTNTYDLAAVNEMMTINVKDYVIKSDMSLDSILALVNSYLRPA